MKRMFSVLLCLGFVHGANATILFYKQSLGVAISGAGRVMNHGFSGFTLLDSSTGDIVFVSADVRSKRFKVEKPTHKLSTVQFSNARSRTVLQIQSGAGEGLNAKGVNTSLNVGGSQTVSSPSTFVVSGCDAYVPSGLPDAYCFEYHGSMVYDKADTIDAATNGLTLDGCTDKVRQLLADRGYTED